MKMYYLYHIPGKKVGVTTDLKRRVEEQQGYGPDEYEVIDQSDDIDFISEGERIMQKSYGYKVDDVLYNELEFNKNKNMKMKINVTEQTTTFPCPVNKLKGRLLDNIGMKWSTDHGEFSITESTVGWILTNVKESMYNKDRCYIYNKAFANFHNNQTRTGGIMMDHREKGINMPKSHFDLIREWASKRGLYKKGDSKTQALKLVEEVGETCRAILKGNQTDIEDGIGDCIVVLTNLAVLCNTDIEHCIESAYNEIKDRKGKMDNGTFKKD